MATSLPQTQAAWDMKVLRRTQHTPRGLGSGGQDLRVNLTRPGMDPESSEGGCCSPRIKPARLVSLDSVCLQSGMPCAFCILLFVRWTPIQKLCRLCCGSEDLLLCWFHFPVEIQCKAIRKIDYDLGENGVRRAHLVSQLLGF